ncbi:MAG: hypothetical protein Kow0062_17930 [Acidobacteriota bacterium]
MAAPASRRSRRVLVVGVGLTGAALAWLAARAGHEVVVTAATGGRHPELASGPAVLRGTILPEPLFADVPLRPAGASVDALADTAGRGERRVIEALMAASRSCGVRPLAFERRFAGRGAEERAGDVERLLRACGSAPHVERTADGDMRVVSDDLLVDTRRLAFELLRLARRAGARWLTRDRIGAVREDAASGGATIEIEGRPEAFDRIAWTCGRPDRRAPFADAFPRRPIVARTFRPGRDELDRALRFDDTWLTPLPESTGMHGVQVLEPGRPPEGGRARPFSLLAAMSRFLGDLQRQRLVDAIDAAPPLLAEPAGSALVLAAPETWPLATLFGRLEAIASV